MVAKNFRNFKNMSFTEDKSVCLICKESVAYLPTLPVSRFYSDTTQTVVSQFLIYVQTVGYVLWYVARGRGTRPCLTCCASLVTAFAQALSCSADFAAEKGWKRSKEGGLRSHISVYLVGDISFSNRSHVSKHHGLQAILGWLYLYLFI